MTRSAWLVIWLIVAAGCTADRKSLTVGDFALPIQPQQVTDRQWKDVALHPLYEIPRDTGVSLYMPGPFVTGSDGSLYFMDPGDMKIKRFDADGRYTHSYGGRGSGPGEFNVFVDAALAGDSVLYVTDPNHRRISFFAVDSPAFLYDLSLPARMYRITRGGRAYWLALSKDSLMGTNVRGGADRHFGTVIKNQTAADRMLLGGYIIPHREDVIYVPTRHPILVRYDSAGTVVYARTTPDFGHSSPPTLERRETPMGFTERVRGRSFNGFTEVYGDKLVVYTSVSSSAKAFDVYDASSGDYEYSISLPWGRIYFASYDPGRRQVWQVQDSTVMVYSVAF